MKKRKACSVKVFAEPGAFVVEADGVRTKFEDIDGARAKERAIEYAQNKYGHWS